MPKTDTSTFSSNRNTHRKLPKWLTGFGAQIVAGLIIGLMLGFLARPTASESGIRKLLGFIGSSYVSLLRFMVPPLVVTAVITSVANLRQVKNAAKLAVSTLLWFGFTALASVLTGIVVGRLVNPGAGASIDVASMAAPKHVGSWWAFFQTVIPDNFLGLSLSSTASGVTPSFNILQLLVISIVFSVAALKVGKAAEPFLIFVESLLGIIQKVLWWLIRLAPIGTVALVGGAVAEYGWETVGNLSKFVMAIYLGLAIVIGVIYPILLKMNGLSVMEFFHRIWPVTSLGFFTRSSMGVMPVTQRIVERRLGIPREYASFAVPLGATTKMDGCAAVYPAVAAIFVAGFYGMPLKTSDYFVIVIVSVVGSAATAGTTGATVMLTLTLSSLGLPLEGVGLLLAIEPIVDMGRTAVNVTGQALVAAVVAKRAGILDHQIWRQGAETSLDADSALMSIAR